MQKEELFKRNMGMVVNVAKRFRNLYGFRFDELLEEATWALAHEVCRGTYDPNRGAESTWAHMVAYWALLTHVRKRRLRTVSLYQVGDEVLSKPARRDWRRELEKDLDEDGKYIIRTILEPPDCIRQVISVRSRAKARESIRGYLREQGWTSVRIERAWQEVSECLG